MNFDTIEGLSKEQINELFSEIVEIGNFDYSVYCDNGRHGIFNSEGSGTRGSCTYYKDRTYCPNCYQYTCPTCRICGEGVWAYLCVR